MLCILFGVNHKKMKLKQTFEITSVHNNKLKLKQMIKLTSVIPAMSYRKN